MAAETLNCLEARGLVLAVPSSLGAALARHLQECPPCRQFAARARNLEARVERALAVPVSATLAGSVALETHRLDARRRTLLAACVSLAALGIGAGALLSMDGDDPFALACIDFVVDEEANAILAAPRAGAQALRDAVVQIGVDLAPQLGDIRYIGHCLFKGTPIHHLIATTPQGKVTMLLAPEKRIDAQREGSARGLHALVFPAGPGSIVLIGESARGLERARQMILHKRPKTSA